METPNCNFCGSTPDKHTTIFVDVKNTKHNLIECNNCHLRFYSPRIPFSQYLANGFGNNEPAKKEAEKMFNNASFSPVENPSQQKKLLKSYYTIRIMNLLKKHEVKFDTIYEIGGSVGWFSHFLKEDYPNIIVDGCELNRYSVEVANTKFGLNYTAGEFKNAIAKENNYDLIVALDYIEHTFTPYDDLQKMNRLLKIGGHIIMKTFLEDLDIKRTMEAPIGHSHHFFSDVLKTMTEKSGFKIVEWVIEGIQVIVIGQKI